MVRDIDFLYLICEAGEQEVIARLSAHGDSKQSATSDRRKELTRLKSCLGGIGVKDFPVDEQTISFFIAQRAWRR
jgi:hypothetical protein